MCVYNRYTINSCMVFILCAHWRFYLLFHDITTIVEGKQKDNILTTPILHQVWTETLSEYEVNRFISSVSMAIVKPEYIDAALHCISQEQHLRLFSSAFGTSGYTLWDGHGSSVSLYSSGIGEQLMSPDYTLQNRTPTIVSEAMLCFRLKFGRMRSPPINSAASEDPIHHNIWRPQNIRIVGQRNK